MFARRISKSAIPGGVSRLSTGGASLCEKEGTENGGGAGGGKLTQVGRLRRSRTGRAFVCAAFSSAAGAAAARHWSRALPSGCASTEQLPEAAQRTGRNRRSQRAVHVARRQQPRQLPSFEARQPPPQVGAKAAASTKKERRAGMRHTARESEGLIT